MCESGGKIQHEIFFPSAVSPSRQVVSKRSIIINFEGEGKIIIENFKSCVICEEQQQRCRKGDFLSVFSKFRKKGKREGGRRQETKD